jgi:hypothetical protein
MLPKKVGQSKSKRVEGAFMHTDVLTCDKVNVCVRMHVKVRDQKQLSTQKLWKVRMLEEGEELHLLLTPAPDGTRANISTMFAELSSQKKRAFAVLFQTLKPPKERPLSPLERRLRLAESRVGRLGA